MQPVYVPIVTILAIMFALFVFTRIGRKLLVMLALLGLFFAGMIYMVVVWLPIGL